MLGQLWEPCVGAADGVAAMFADPALFAADPATGAVDDEVDDAGADVCDVAALAMARLPPKPAPIAAAATAAAAMVRPTLICNVTASFSGWWIGCTQDTGANCGAAAAKLCFPYERPSQFHTQTIGCPPIGMAGGATVQPPSSPDGDWWGGFFESLMDVARRDAGWITSGCRDGAQPQRR